MAAESKRCRWRKDKKETAEQEASGQRHQQQPPQPLQRRLADTATPENLAAAHAFRGLHGGKSNLSLISGAVDNVYQTVLGGNAHYYQGLACPPDDFTTFETLARELDYVPCWMSGGTPLYRPTALGSEEALKKSPTYEQVVRRLSGFFGVEPIRSLVNYYRNGEDYTSFHSDQYFSGVNMTIGASFGEERNLVFEHRDSKEQFNFPQHNGDVFAFTAEINNRFMHAVPRQRQRSRSASAVHMPGRISVIIWARQQPDWKKLAATSPINLMSLPHVLDYDPAAPHEKKEDASDEERAAAAVEGPSPPKASPSSTSASPPPAAAAATALQTPPKAAAPPPPPRPSAAAAVAATPGSVAGDGGYPPLAAATAECSGIATSDPPGPHRSRGWRGSRR